MAAPTEIDAKEVVNLAAKLATAENRLWNIVEERQFSKLAPKGGAMGGEEMVVKLIDPYFANTKLADIPQPITDLSFLKDANGKMDPKVQAFVDAHKGQPEVVAGFVEYANQYVTIAKNTAALNESLVTAGLKPEDAEGISARVIGDVDGLYAEGGVGSKGFNAARIVQDALADKAPALLKASVNMVTDRESSSVSLGGVAVTNSTVDGKAVSLVQVAGVGDIVMSAEKPGVISIGGKEIEGPAAEKLHRDLQGAVETALKDRNLTLVEASDISAVANAGTFAVREQQKQAGRSGGK